MSALNPYESFLDGRPVQDILLSTPAALAQAVGRIPATSLTASPAPGRWSAAQVVSHLADCEIAFGFRLRQTLAEENHTIQPFDQDKWAPPYSKMDAAIALQTFAAVRAWNLELIRAAGSEGAARIATHPERGTMTFQTILETMAGHDLNHLGQLHRLAAQI